VGPMGLAFWGVGRPFLAARRLSSRRQLIPQPTVTACLIRHRRSLGWPAADLPVSPPADSFGPPMKVKNSFSTLARSISYVVFLGSANGNELKIPLVGVGTIDAVRAIQTDPQLANRFGNASRNVRTPGPAQ